MRFLRQLWLPSLPGTQVRQPQKCKVDAADLEKMLEGFSGVPGLNVEKLSASNVDLITCRCFIATYLLAK